MLLCFYTLLESASERLILLQLHNSIYTLKFLLTLYFYTWYIKQNLLLVEFQVTAFKITFKIL